LLICEITVEDAADCHHEENEFMIPEPFVTANEVAEHLKITRRQVLEMARKNQLPAHPISFGRQRKIWRFKIIEVDQAVASGTPKPANADSQRTIDTSNTIIGGSPRSQKRKL
jgi:excisionase family DNA binding protein